MAGAIHRGQRDVVFGILRLSQVSPHHADVHDAVIHAVHDALPQTQRQPRQRRYLRVT